jgi:hypothetical protein
MGISDDTFGAMAVIFAKVCPFTIVLMLDKRSSYLTSVCPYISFDFVFCSSSGSIGRL